MKYFPQVNIIDGLQRNAVKIGPKVLQQRKVNENLTEAIGTGAVNAGKKNAIRIKQLSTPLLTAIPWIELHRNMDLQLHIQTLFPLQYPIAP